MVIQKNFRLQDENSGKAKQVGRYASHSVDIAKHKKKKPVVPEQEVTYCVVYFLLNDSFRNLGFSKGFYPRLVVFPGGKNVIVA